MMLGGGCSPCCIPEVCFPPTVSNPTSVAVTLSAFNSQLCLRRLVGSPFNYSTAHDHFVFDGDTTYAGTHILDVQSETESAYLVASPTLQNLSSSCINQGKIWGVVYKNRPQFSGYSLRWLAPTAGVIASNATVDVIASFYVPITSAWFFDPPTRTNGYNDFDPPYTFNTSCVRDSVVPFADHEETIFGQWSQDRVEDAFSSRTYLWRFDACCGASFVDGSPVFAVGGGSATNSSFFTIPSAPGRVSDPVLGTVFSQTEFVANYWGFNQPQFQPSATGISFF